MAPTLSNISKALACDATRVVDSESSSMSGSQRSHGAVGPKPAGLGVLGLPTPPNSISPLLPPIPYRDSKHPNESAASPLSQIDSDIDLDDEVEHANSQDQPAHEFASFGSNHASASADGMGTVTALMLAKHHLADLLIERGPLKIRDMIHHLSKIVPGFKDIMPTKARRIVVAALENRAGGGFNGEVEFEKVGWGLWNAHTKGQTHLSKGSRMIYPIREAGGPVDARSAPAGAVRIPNSTGRRRPSKQRRSSYGSWTGDGPFAAKLHTGEQDRGHVDVAEDEADNMSIDGDEEDEVQRPNTSGARHILSPRSVAENYSDTDEEDWASCGVQALRAGSISSSASGVVSRSAIHSQMRQGLNRRPSAFTTRSLSAPGGAAVLDYHREQQKRSSSLAVKPEKVDFTGVEANQDEREAIIALMTMGSV